MVIITHPDAGLRVGQMFLQGQLALRVIGDFSLEFLGPRYRPPGGAVRWRRLIIAANFVPVDGADIGIIVIATITIVMIIAIVSVNGFWPISVTAGSSLLLLAAIHDDSLLRKRKGSRIVVALGVHPVR